MSEEVDLFGSIAGTCRWRQRGWASALAVRLMVGLLYLKHAYNESDETVCERWAENVYFQYFCGEEYFQPRLPCDPTNLVRFRQALGEAGVEELLAATIAAAVQMKAVTPVEFERVIVDTTVQEKAIAYPTDSRLLEVARARLVQLAQRAGLALKQTYEREGKRLRRRAGGYAHAKQFKRLRRVLKRQRTVWDGCCAISNASCPEPRTNGRHNCASGLSGPGASAASVQRTRTSSTHCMRRKLNASAKERRASPTSSASR